jgi:hypothetical protein
MSSIRTTFAGLGAAVGSSVALLLGGIAPAATADPVSPLPIDAAQAPGLSAVQGIGPVIQRAAADPTNAAAQLMAAAAAFAGNSALPSDSRNVATAVNQFVAHVPAPGAVPGTEAHLPAGVDPAHAVGPVPQAAPVAAPIPEAAPAPPAVPAPAPAPAPDAAVPAAAPAFGPDTPPTQDFMYPSISNGCLADGGNVLATAISVAGPAKIPAPGPAAGQTAYVFTAIGTPAPAAEQKLPLNVTWVNLTTGKSGSATLKPRPDINPNGPTTLSTIVDTGSGSIISTIFGQVTTVEKQCQFMPTIGSTVVP